VVSAIFRFLPSLRGGRDRGRGEAPSRVKGMGDVRKNYVSRKRMNRCIKKGFRKFPNKKESRQKKKFEGRKRSIGETPR